MADRHLALHAERRGALDDQLHREGADLARLVQVDVDAACRSVLRQPNTVSRWPLGSRSIAHGSRPPTTSAPSASAWSISSTRAGTHQHAGLRERDDLDVDHVAIALARRHHALDAGRGRPRCRRRHGCGCGSMPLATDSTICRADWRAGSMPSSLLQRRSLSILSISRGPAWLRCQPMPQQRLVEMGVRLDQARQRDARRRRRSSRPWLEPCADRRDAPVDDADRRERPGHRADIA